MSDLDDLLLEAAGRTGGSARSKQTFPPSKRQLRGSDSDDESDSREEDSDDNRHYGGMKSSGSDFPLKKRPKNKDDGGSDREMDSSDESDVGSDLYRDEDDRRQLEQLTELEREMILSDRAAKRDDKKLQMQMRSRLVGDRKSKPGRESTPPASSRGVRASARSADRSAARTDALKELQARRMRRDPEGKQKLSDQGSASRMKHKGFLGLSRSESESESDSHSEDEGSTGDTRMDYSDEDKEKTDSDVPTFEEITSITIRRSKLAKWFMEPFFEELVVGGFVRVGIGMKAGQSVYRLCIIQDVDASDPNKRYLLENRTTHKYLNCVWGSESSAARWQMARVSDSPPTEEEFKQWVKEVERTGGRMPRRSEILEKKEAIDKVNNFVYSAETVKQILQEKKKSGSTRPMNIAAEKQKLRREAEIALERKDKDEVERINARLQELEALRQAQDLDRRAVRLAEMNRKNRAENFSNASGSRAADPSLNPGDAGYDPFSRRWTRSRNYYAPNNENGTPAVAPAAVTKTTNKTRGGANAAGVAATEAALEAAAGAGKLVDTKAPVDLGTESNVVHDFELPISLAPLQRYGGPQGAAVAFMARKQRIEAKVGCRVAEDDGRRHSMTLTVGDYKRRRGLL